MPCRELGGLGDRPWRCRHRQHERPAVEREHAHVRDGHDRRCARDVADERQLAERLAGTEPGDDDTSLIDRDRSGLDDVEPVADVTLADDRRARRDRSRNQRRSGGFERGCQYRGEQRQAPQQRDLAERDRHGRFTSPDRAQRRHGDHRQQHAGHRDRADDPEGRDQTPAASAPTAAPAIEAASAIPNTTASRFVGTRRWSTVRTATSTTPRPTPAPTRSSSDASARATTATATTGTAQMSALTSVKGVSRGRPTMTSVVAPPTIQPSPIAADG